MKFRIKTVNPRTGRENMLSHEFSSMTDAIEVVRFMATGGKNEYQIVDEISNRVATTIKGNYCPGSVLIH